MKQRKTKTEYITEEEEKAEFIKALRDLKDEVKKWPKLIGDIIRLLLTR